MRDKYHNTSAGVARVLFGGGYLALLGTCSSAVVVVNGADVAGITLRIDDVVVNGYAVIIARFFDIVGSCHEIVFCVMFWGVVCGVYLNSIRWGCWRCDGGTVSSEDTSGDCDDDCNDNSDNIHGV